MTSLPSSLSLRFDSFRSEQHVSSGNRSSARRECLSHTLPFTVRVYQWACLFFPAFQIILSTRYSAIFLFVDFASNSHFWFSSDFHLYSDFIYITSFTWGAVTCRRYFVSTAKFLLPKTSILRFIAIKILHYYQSTTPRPPNPPGRLRRSARSRCFRLFFARWRSRLSCFEVYIPAIVILGLSISVSGSGIF